MGGRGSTSGIGLSQVSSNQRAKMQNIKNALSGKKGMSTPVFSVSNDGSVQYSYTETRTLAHVKGGKMISPEKDDVYERTTTYSGVILKDGLIKKNKHSYVEKLIKRGKKV